MKPSVVWIVKCPCEIAKLLCWCIRFKSQKPVMRCNEGPGEINQNVRLQKEKKMFSNIMHYKAAGKITSSRIGKIKSLKNYAIKILY